jgi:large subunit ribosomal protein L3
MAKIHKPRAGSRAYRPLKRARRERPRLKSWPQGDSKILGFTGYKAGMTHCIALDDDKNSPTSGSEVFIPVTVLETPPMRVVGVRVYRRGYMGSESFTDIWCESVGDDAARRLGKRKNVKPDKKLAQVEKEIGQASDIRLIAHTQPALTASPKKTPDVMEVSLSGSPEEKLAYAREVLGKDVSISDVFKENQFIDVTAVTKGKGYQGVVKRYGIKRQPRKATKKRRHLGSGGSWTPARKLWVEPQPGQMGYQTRTEYNKLILKVGGDGGEVTPAGGFLHYGPVKGDYVMVYGSVPGPSKRVVRLTHPRRLHGRQGNLTVKHIDTTSKQGA